MGGSTVTALHYFSLIGQHHHSVTAVPPQCHHSTMGSRYFNLCYCYNVWLLQNNWFLEFKFAYHYQYIVLFISVKWSSPEFPFCSITLVSTLFQSWIPDRNYKISSHEGDNISRFVIFCEILNQWILCDSFVKKTYMTTFIVLSLIGMTMCTITCTYFPRTSIRTHLIYVLTMLLERSFFDQFFNRGSICK